MSTAKSEHFDHPHSEHHPTPTPTPTPAYVPPAVDPAKLDQFNRSVAEAVRSLHLAADTIAQFQLGRVSIADLNAVGTTLSRAQSTLSTLSSVAKDVLYLHP